MHAAGRLAALAAVAALVGGCKGETTAPTGSITAFLSAVRLEGSSTNASLVRGDAPSPAGGPSLTLAAPSSAINGGTSAVGLAGSAAFQVVVVTVVGQPDYYQLSLPAAATSASILVTVSQEAPVGTFQLSLAVGGGAGSLGAYATQPVTLVSVGTGDVQVSLSWNSAADVDLHVVEPGGEEIYYSNDVSGTGGELDLDSNAGCGSDGPRNENITWAEGTAPAGEYIVRVDYWDNCGATQTDWVVTVHVQGQQPKVFSGSFTGEGDNGGEGSGTEVTRFTK
jgi:hypothetical protein